MVVRIRLRRAPAVANGKGAPRDFALAAASLLTPSAVATCALAIWRIGADLQWTGQFAISSGIFSHWQVWVALSALLQLGASALNRYGRGDVTAS